MEFLLESTTINVLPPTPPCDADLDNALDQYDTGGPSLMPPPHPTGLTPAVEMGPPPEYSPPARGSIHALVVEKGEAKTFGQAPPDSQLETEGSSSSDDGLYHAVRKSMGITLPQVQHRF